MDKDLVDNLVTELTNKFNKLKNIWQIYIFESQESICFIEAILNRLGLEVDALNTDERVYREQVY